jgi:SAM-dependent methyltransferase
LNDAFEKKWFAVHLRCPDCGNALHVGVDLACSACDRHLSLSPPVDLRPTRPKRTAIELNAVALAAPDNVLKTVDISPPNITYEGPQAQRDSRELISEMLKWVPQNGRVLDLGCGPRDQAKPMESVGYQYLGVDYSSPSADLLVDAHSMPFCDNSFECVFSYAVLEHLRCPVIAIREIERVLRSGGVFIGTVSQGEPFHASYFHHTAWGLVSLAESSTAMRVSRLWCGPTTLRSLTTMGRYPKVIKMLLKLVDQVDTLAPWLAPRRQAWSHKDKQLDALYRAGSICFAMEKASSTTC